MIIEQQITMEVSKVLFVKGGNVRVETGIKQGEYTRGVPIRGGNGSYVTVTPSKIMVSGLVGEEEKSFNVLFSLRQALGVRRLMRDKRLRLISCYPRMVTFVQNERGFWDLSEESANEWLAVAGLLEKNSKEIVIRITRHELDSDCNASLKTIYGTAVCVVTEDIPYGDNPVAAVKALIERIEIGGNRVVAVEVQAPLPVLMTLVNRQRDLGVTLIRAQFERDAGGRVIAVGKDEKGRDIFKFSHYEELLRIEFETRRLG